MSAAQRVSGVDNSPASKRKMAAGTQSLNHLLNFSLPPRQTHLPPPRRSRRTGTHQGIWNKEKFLNAQYRFIMNPNGDYTVHFADPDIYYQWQDILQVIVPRSSALSIAGSSADVSRESAEGHACPICLSPPAAARMTKCGHIFCFPCILHYLGTSETTKWARCPICFDSVASHQLRSVHWYDEPAAPEPGLLQMRLMERPQITTLALPRSPTWPSDALPPHQAPFHFMPDVFAFAKFMIATPDYMINELSRELDELATERRTLERLADTLGVTFVDAAEEKVRRQLAKANALDIGPLREAELRARQEADTIAERARRRAEYEAQRREPSTHNVAEEVPDALLAAATTARAPRVRKNVNPPPPSSSTYFFYQAASGAPIFLHPLDIRVLLARFGSYSAFPDAITVRVEAAQEGTVDDALRKRCKYLGHVPEAADVVFVEADLREVVGADALAPFEAALRMRRARRKDKEKKDDKARAKAEERERAKLGITPAEPLPPPHPVEVWEAVPDELFAELPPRETADEHHEEEVQPAPRGAWGSRSFAAALHSTREQAAEDVHDDHTEDFDNAWADFEVQARGGGGGGGGGRRGGNKKSKLVIIGGGGGGARRRR